MALNSNAIVTAAVGYIYTAPVGTAAPSVTDVDNFDYAVTGNEEQTVTISGSPTGGTFTLTYDGQTTSALNHNASNSSVQSALEALTNIGTGNVSVTGGPLPGTAVKVVFKGKLSATDVVQMTATSSLTGGSTPSVSVSTTKTAWAWKSVGHTARDELPVFGYEGGETETRGSWQAAVIKEVVTEPASDYVTFNVHQFDEKNLELYYGSTNASSTVGVFSVSGSATSGTTEKALLIIIVDGSTKIAFHAEKTSIRREDSIELAIDEFAFMPLRATLVLNDGASFLFSWISTDTGVNP